MWVWQLNWSSTGQHVQSCSLKQVLCGALPTTTRFKVCKGITAEENPNPNDYSPSSSAIHDSGRNAAAEKYAWICLRGACMRAKQHRHSDWRRPAKRLRCLCGPRHHRRCLRSLHGRQAAAADRASVSRRLPKRAASSDEKSPLIGSLVTPKPSSITELLRWKCYCRVSRSLY